MAAKPPPIVSPTALVVLWLAVGRGGEVGNCTWESCRFDGTNGVFFMNWSELKTASNGDMPFTSDAWSWHLDFFHKMARCVEGWGDETHPLPAPTTTNNNIPTPSLHSLPTPSLPPSGTSS